MYPRSIDVRTARSPLSFKGVAALPYNNSATLRLHMQQAFAKSVKSLMFRKFWTLLKLELALAFSGLTTMARLFYRTSGCPTKCFE